MRRPPSRAYLLYVSSLDSLVSMPQLHCSVPRDIEDELRARAKARKLPLSKFLAEVLTKEVRRGWPPGFFENVYGAWKDLDIERPPQGEYETRRPW